MIWSADSETLARHCSMLETSGMTRPVELIKDPELVGQGSGDIKYFPIPSHAHEIGKMVVPFVSIGEDGILVPGNQPHAPTRYYGVTARPNSLKGIALAVQRTQETHVLAEDLALRHGIFTPHGRSVAEVALTELVHPASRRPYVEDRVAHLEALRQEIATHDFSESWQQHQATTEINRALQALKPIK
jgi:hypothetical protein